MKLKGKAQADPAAGPSVVEQMDPEPDPVVDPEPDPVSPVPSARGQEASQYPQAPTPETWSLLASVWVEHQGVVSPSMVVQLEWETPPKLNGKTQGEPAPGPDVALHTVGDPEPEQLSSQYPQASTPEMWSSLASVLVEHQSLVSSTVVQFE